MPKVECRCCRASIQPTTAEIHGGLCARCGRERSFSGRAARVAGALLMPPLVAAFAAFVLATGLVLGPFLFAAWAGERLLRLAVPFLFARGDRARRAALAHARARFEDAYGPKVLERGASHLVVRVYAGRTRPPLQLFYRFEETEDRVIEIPFEIGVREYGGGLSR